jgi:hypothetical protein
MNRKQNKLLKSAKRNLPTRKQPSKKPRKIERGNLLKIRPLRSEQKNWRKIKLEKNKKENTP